MYYANFHGFEKPPPLRWENFLFISLTINFCVLIVYVSDVNTLKV